MNAMSRQYPLGTRRCCDVDSTSLAQLENVRKQMLIGGIILLLP